MKVTLINFFQTINNRGAETYVDQLANQLSSNHSVEVLSATPGAIVPSTDHQLNLARRVYLDPLNIKLLTWTLSQIKKLNTSNPDVVVALNAGWPVLILRIWTLLHGKRLFVPGQSGPGWDDRVNLLFNPDVFICLTKTQLRWAKQAFHWPWQKFALIPNGVNLEAFSTAQPHHPEINKPIIITVAASTPAKRVLQTIRAVARLKKASLLLLGSGPLDDEINELGKMLLGEQRFLHMSVNHVDVPKYYKAANLFTLCSQSSEAFGIVYLEAMAANLPVVATKDASRREIVGDAGIFVSNPDNSKEYAQKLEAALSRRWGNKPISQAKNFSWTTIGQQYEKLLKTT